MRTASSTPRPPSSTRSTRSSRSSARLLYVGTSGWHYRHWRALFYPERLPTRAWLRHYAARFQLTEVNSTFYGLPKRSTVESWVEETPADFVFVLKFSRFLTHRKRLLEPEAAVERFFERVEPLGERLGPVLLQLPPDMRAEPRRLDDALRAMPRGVRVAVECRHESWFTDEVRGLLERHDAALCLADRGSRPVAPLWRTSDWGYLRLHGGRGSPASCYGRASMERWAERLDALWPAGAPVYVFFNNDMHGCALRDARRFALAARRRGLEPSRVPAANEVALR